MSRQPAFLRNFSRLSAVSSRPRCRAAMEDINSSLAKAKVSDLDGSAPDSTDFANYFCAYAYIYHQARIQDRTVYHLMS